MSATIRTMPTGLRLFLAYAFFILAGIGLSLRWVIDQAVSTPVTLVGVVWMALLAFTVFTITLVLQRKQAARPMTLVLASLTIPAIPLLAFAFQAPGGLLAAVVAVVLFRGLTRPSVRAFLSEP